MAQAKLKFFFYRKKIIGENNEPKNKKKYMMNTDMPQTTSQAGTRTCEFWDSKEDKLVTLKGMQWNI